MSDIIYSLPFLWNGLSITLQVSVLVMIIATFLGILGGISLAYGPTFLYWPIRVYVDIVRGIPVLVLIFSVYYGLPAIGIDINNFAAGVTALAAFSAAHVTEITRGAIQSLHQGQMEAGMSIGLTFFQRLAYVIFPQAVRRFLPPWINSVTDMVKGSALISLVGVVDLMLAVQQVIGRTYRPLPLYITGAFFYFAINYSLSSTSRWVEKRFDYNT
jgi:polar amino acid transport system permease protein